MSQLRDSAESEMRNRAAAMGANVVLLQSDDTGFGGSIFVGDAYRCDAVTTTPPDGSARVTKKEPAEKQHVLKPSRMLVLELRPMGEIEARVTSIFTDLLLSGLTDVAGLTVVSIKDLETALDVQRTKDLLSCEQVSCIAEIGGALGVDLVAYGTIGNLGSKYSISVTVIDTSNTLARARSAVTIQREEDMLPDAVPVLLADIVNKLNR